MQTLNNIPQDFHLTRHFARLYELYSEGEFPKAVDAPFEIRKLLCALHKRAGVPEPAGRCIDWPLPEHPIDKGKIVVGFSGGKDCLATALSAQAEGLSPYLLFLEGLNKSVPSERRCAEDVAQAAGFPLAKVNLKVTGTKEHRDHPLKNLLILCAMMDYGASIGAGYYAIGSHFDENSTHGNMDIDMSDSQDLIYALMRFAQRKRYVAGFKTYLFSTTHAYYVIYKYNRGLLDKISTCITPDYRRPMIYKANVRKYGSGLILPNRCGTCHKCGEEYVMRCRLGLVRMQPEYFRKCYNAREDFKKNYIPDFPRDAGTNAYGGANAKGVQILSDRIGYLIGTLQWDEGLRKWFPDKFYGRRHYTDRAYAEKVLGRFVSLYRKEPMKK